MQAFLNCTGRRVYLYSEAVDMRVGFERLFYYVREQMNQDLLKGDIYLFLGKNRSRAKVLLFDGTGLVLIIKRLERGSFQSLGDLVDRKEFTSEELSLILAGTHVNFRFSSMEELAKDFFKKKSAKSNTQAAVVI